MKRTIKSLLLAMWIVFAAACSKDSADTEGPSEPQGPDDPQTELCTVTVRLNGIDQSIEPISKAVTTLPDTLRLRVTMNVFDQNGSIASKEEKLLTETGSDIPIEFQVKKGTYNLAFWADYVVFKNESVTAEAFSVNDLRKITIKQNLSSDAFSLVLKNVEINSDQNITSGTTLKRAISMLTIKSTDDLPENAASVTYTISKTVTGLNLLSGEAVYSQTSTTYTTSVEAGAPLDVSRYMLPCEQFDCSVEVVAEDGSTIVDFTQTGVNTEANSQTTLEGEMFDPNLSPSIGLTIEEEWGEEKVIPVEVFNLLIPDAKFREYCLANFDTDGDGVISREEAELVTKIDIKTDAILSLTGIEYFTNLETLIIGTKNLQQGKLTALNLKKNVNLTYLKCEFNPLTELDLSGNPNLQELYCHYNNLTALDLSHNPKLTILSCYERQIDAIDLRNNPLLTSFACGDSQITELDFSQNPELQEVDSRGNPLKTIDVSKSPKLISLACYGSQIATLDLTNNPVLDSLSFWGNQITQLDLSNNTELTYLSCYNNQLTELDLSKNTKLTYLSCNNNQLTALDVSNNTQLTELWCSDNQLTQLNLSVNTKLTKLSCGDNQLSKLDLSNNTELTQVGCSGNQLTGIELSNNSQLTTLICSSNQLAELDLSDNTELTIVNCEYNQLTEIDLSNNKNLTELFCNGNQLSGLDLSNNTELTFVYCKYNQLTEIDLSTNAVLKIVDCRDNPLETIYVFEGYSFFLDKPVTTQVVVK